MASLISIFFAIDVREQSNGVDAKHERLTPHQARGLNRVIDRLVDN
jgi:hypothetical protein